jgi:hypothetical protein
MMRHFSYCNFFSGLTDLPIDNFHFGTVPVSGERLFGGGA